MLVDGRPRAKRHAVAAGERVDGRRAARGARARGAARRVRGRLRGRAPARGRQAGRRRRAPGRRPPHRHARAGAGGPRGRRPRPRAPRRRAPAGPRHVRAAGAGPLRARSTPRCRRRCGRARSSASTSRSSRAARRPGAARSTRRSGRDRRVRTRMSTDTDDAARRGHPLRGRAQPAARRRCCACGCETGRTHQIRAHLKAIGHPVLGDPGVRASPALRAPAPVPARRAAGVHAPRDGRADRPGLAAAAGRPRERSLVEHAMRRPRGPPHRPGRRTVPPEVGEGRAVR